MEFENLSKRINSLVNFDTSEKPPFECKQVPRLTMDKGEMVKKTCKNKILTVKR